MLADSGFFYSKNLENANSRDDKNAEFIRQVLTR